MVIGSIKHRLRALMRHAMLQNGDSCPDTPRGIACDRPAATASPTMNPVLRDPEAKKALDARLARVEGQIRAVRRMMVDDESCEDIALQLAAARKALDRAFYEMVSCMIRMQPSGLTARREHATKVADLLARFG